MKRNTLWLAVLVIGLAAAGCAPEYSSYRYREHRPVRDSTMLMTKQDVIALSKARIGDNVIIDMIRKSGSTFVLRTPDVIELADSGVSDTVISAMMKSDEPWGGGRAPARYYAGYPPYYGYSYWDYPWWSPWYFSGWYGYWGAYYHPYYYRGYAPYYGGYRYRSYGGGGGGVYRSMGRRR
ncbi:MAG TPA: hypothetical protein VL221_03415 [Bacteroidota bacterium]|nr:hypothetical protein [Bacteroidota bacterium]